jgi:hypothetical protein
LAFCCLDAAGHLRIGPAVVGALHFWCVVNYAALILGQIAMLACADDDESTRPFIFGTVQFIGRLATLCRDGVQRKADCGRTRSDQRSSSAYLSVQRPASCG